MGPATKAEGRSRRHCRGAVRRQQALMLSELRKVWCDTWVSSLVACTGPATGRAVFIIVSSKSCVRAPWSIDPARFSFFNPLPWPGNGDHPETPLSRLTPNVGENRPFYAGTPPQHACATLVG
eukprot:scaffold332_cov64-Phaeocystis_antarctica.AAC.1